MNFQFLKDNSLMALTTAVFLWSGAQLRDLTETAKIYGQQLVEMKEHQKSADYRQDQQRDIIRDVRKDVGVLQVDIAVLKSHR